tara:strand:+ start:366 stop:593 length:228 start_codon:yes stop_codon:yes gene_type:complete
MRLRNKHDRYKLEEEDLIMDKGLEVKYRRKEYSASIDGPGIPIERNGEYLDKVFETEELLEKLKDFNYWKEWRNK